MLDKKDFQDVKLARPVAVVDMWDLDDRVTKLENLVEQLATLVSAIAELYHQDRVKQLEMLFTKILENDKGGRKYGKEKPSGGRA